MPRSVTSRDREQRILQRQQEHLDSMSPGPQGQRVLSPCYSHVCSCHQSMSLSALCPFTAPHIFSPSFFICKVPKFSLWPDLPCLSLSSNLLRIIQSPAWLMDQGHKPITCDSKEGPGVLGYWQKGRIHYKYCKSINK